MKREEIESVLNSCTNLIELVGKANELKASGAAETIVNRIVTKRRKELLTIGNSIKRIKREVIPDVDDTPMGRIPVSIQNLGLPTIFYDGTNVLM
jgi:hypothetical protein